MIGKQVVTGASLMALFGHSFQLASAQRFTAEQAVGRGPGTPFADPFEENANFEMGDPRDPDAFLEQQGFNAVRIFSRTCDCVPREDNELNSTNIRAISDEFAADGNAPSSFGLSNMVWSFGQFIDHDVALGIEDVRFGTRFPIGAAQGSFNAEREVDTFRRGCPAALNIHTGQIDAGMIYGTDPTFLRETVRIPGLCNLRIAGTGVGEFPPVTSAANENGAFFFIAGDIRIVEHSFLFSQHTVWLREHNRLCDVARERNPTFTEEELFTLVQNVVIAKLQKVVLEEFLPALQITQEDLQTAKRLINTPDTSTEFSMAYRMGHDLVPNFVGDLSVTDLFQPVRVFLERKETEDGVAVRFKDNADKLIDDLMSALATSKANELDGKISDALRNTLFGRRGPNNGMGGQDLVGRNIFRSRDVNLPTYAGLAKCFGITPDATTEDETPDAWMGLVREPRIPDNVFGPTQRAIIVEQFHRSFFGPGGLFWRDNLDLVKGFEKEIEEGNYATIINANTNAKVKGNVFLVD